MKKAAVAFACIVAISLPLWAQQVTWVAICDYSKVMATSFKESQAVRDLENFRAAYLKEVQAVSADITSLESQKLDADKVGNKPLSLQLDDQISQKKEYLDNYKRIKNDQYKAMAARILDTSFLKDIRTAVAFVADRDGYALVLRSDGPGAELILYNIAEVDITERVIKRIYELAGKPYGGN
jgi:outer membrane protein